MKRCLIIALILTVSVCSMAYANEPANGPLRIDPDNPRYFNDGEKTVLLTGSHVWNNLVDMAPSDPPVVFDFEGYLDFMDKYNHNFIRLWAWELSSWDTRGNREKRLHTVWPHPFARTGPGKALDGKPKFDLTEYDKTYFTRLRERVEAAGKRGIYVSIMLFEGWGLQFSPDAWKSHPFNKDNNINGVNGDTNGDGKGLEIHTINPRQILQYQEDYVKEVIDTVNDLDNVLFEISNENHPPSTKWQYHMIHFIDEYERTKPKQHPVGMTFQYKGGKNQTLFDSPAEWISPNAEGGYRDNPPAYDGSKVILSDTDHLWGIGGNQAWVWKSFLRGLNPIFMDPYDAVVLRDVPFDPQYDPIRRSMGYVLNYAKRMNLTAVTPQNDLASSQYCLADKGNEYLIYLPKGDKVEVDLSSAEGNFQVEWLEPSQNITKEGKSIKGGKKQTLTSPFGQTDAVLYLKK